VLVRVDKSIVINFHKKRKAFYARINTTNDDRVF